MKQKHSVTINLNKYLSNCPGINKIHLFLDLY